MGIFFDMQNMNAVKNNNKKKSQKREKRKELVWIFDFSKLGGTLLF